MYYSKLILLESHIIQIILQAIEENDPNLNEKIKELFPIQYRKAKLKAFW